MAGVNPRVNVARCGRRSQYGTCHRTRGHQSVHATFIGEPSFWFAWAGRVALGYGQFDHGRFRSAS